MVCALRGHHERVTSITFVHSGAILVSASCVDDSVHAWNVEAATLMHVISIKYLWGVVGSPSHPLVVAGGGGAQNLIVYDAELNQCFDLRKPGRGAAMMHDGTSFITGDQDSGITTWELRPLLEHRKQKLKGGPSLFDGEQPSLVGIRTDGPQVGLVSISAFERLMLML